jgi:hypothetical protein
MDGDHTPFVEGQLERTGVHGDPKYELYQRRKADYGGVIEAV